jgi:hypothetical protein
MRDIVICNIKDRFNVLDELAKPINEVQLSSKLDVPKC